MRGALQTPPNEPALHQNPTRRCSPGSRSPCSRPRRAQATAKPTTISEGQQAPDRRRASWHPSFPGRPTEVNLTVATRPPGRPARARIVMKWPATRRRSAARGAEINLVGGIIVTASARRPRARRSALTGSCPRRPRVVRRRLGRGRRLRHGTKASNTCAYVARKLKRCKAKNTDGFRNALEACPRTCGTC